MIPSSLFSLLRLILILTPGSGKTLAFLIPLLESLYRARWSAVDGLGGLVISPTRELSLHASAALMGSELERFTLTNGNTGGGRALANTPGHGHTIGVRHETRGGFFARIERTARAAQFDSNNHDEARRAFAVVNAAAGWARGGWSVTVWARNLLDARHEKRVFFFGNAEPDYAETRYESRADPRQAGVTLARRF